MAKATVSELTPIYGAKRLYSALTSSKHQHELKSHSETSHVVILRPIKLAARYWCRVRVLNACLVYDLSAETHLNESRPVDILDNYAYNLRK